MISDCGMSLHKENLTSADLRRLSQSQLRGRFPWGTSVKTFFQIDLSETYRFKITAIATQGGANLNNWVKRYGLRFSAGAKPVHYREYGIQKVRYNDITHVDFQNINAHEKPLLKLFACEM